MIRIAILLALILAAAPAADEHVYFIGNSVTDTLNYNGFAGFGAAQKIPVVWGRHMIPGAPLEWLWSHQDAGFSEPPFGTSQNAVNAFAWDDISLQPFDRQIDSDVAVIRAVVDLQAKRNPACRYWIYQRWPRMQHLDGTAVTFDKDDYDPAKGRLHIDLATIATWSTLHEHAFTNGWDFSNEGRDYFQQLLTAIRKAEPQAQFRLVPVGDVMAELDARMKAKQIPGWTTVWQLYKDGIHLGPTGSYLCGATFAAALLGLPPKSLATDAYGAVDPALAPIIQDCIATVIKRTPDAAR